MPTQTKINRSDLKFYPSERLTDNDDGGGMPLGLPIRGEANELFNPISSIARVNGGFYTRLVYAGVQRADDEPLIGSYVAITKPPTDTNVGYVLSPASKYGELRADSIKRIESYNIKSIESRMTLLSTQSANSKIIQAYQRVGEPLPLVGDIYCLSQLKAGYTQAEQYVKVMSVDSEVRKFTTRDKEFERLVVKLELSAKLNQDFVGVDYPIEGYADAPCQIRETNAVDAGQYYGVKPITAAITAGAQSLKVDGIMTKLVPTNDVPVPLKDLTAAGQRQTVLDAARAGADGVLTLTLGRYHSAGSISQFYLGNAAAAGSVVISTSAGQITEKGGALLLNASPVGTFDNARGQGVINAPSFAATLNSVAFRAAASKKQVSDTARIDIEINNRSKSHTLTLDPVPALGSLQVSFRAQERWYDLVDDGSGVLRGLSPEHGSGSLNPATGTLSIDCGELPDVGSSILIFWSTRATYFNRAGGAATAAMLLSLADAADPASLTLAWNDGAAKTATCDAAGNITGAWTGKYNPATQQIRINTSAGFNHPAGLLDITASYNTAAKTQLTFTPTLDASGKVALTLGAVALKPNTVVIKYKLDTRTAGNETERWLTLTDNGAGKLINPAGAEVGTVDYATRQALFDPQTTVKVKQAVYNTVQLGQTRPVSDGTAAGSAGSGGNTTIMSAYRSILSHYEYVDKQVSISLSDSAVEAFFYDTSPTTAKTEALKSGSIEIDLLTNFGEVIAPASVNFSWGGKAYFDRLGALCTDLNTTTGAATTVGSIDYAAGTATLTSWRWTNGAAPIITALMTSIDGNPVDAVTFRTPVAPVRPSSMQLRATALDGTKITATANAAGVLSSAYMLGGVDTQYGVAQAKFGELVTAAGNENEPWYNVAAVDENGKIWKPKHVLADSIIYNAEGYTYLPVDSTVVKIDTVRLPQDGRVPIFRRGDTILITNSKTDDIGSAHTGGQTVALSRSDVDRICITDANNIPVTADKWDYDLAAGSITWKTPLDLSSYKMPLTVKHTREERNRILTADIDGTLSLMFPLKRDYAVADTYVSSVLIGGDLQVRHSIPFTQRNWDSVWRDTPNGSQLLNKLNLKDYPMVLTDDGAITERWMIKFTSSGQFELYGETLGFVGRYDTLTDLKPINPATQKPYLTIPKQAFGNDAPWAVQDVIRFDTWGTLLPVLVLCAVQPSSTAPAGEDGFTMCVYGDTTEIK